MYPPPPVTKIFWRMLTAFSTDWKIDTQRWIIVITGLLLTGMWVCSILTQPVRELRGFTATCSILFHFIWMELFH